MHYTPNGRFPADCAVDIDPSHWKLSSKDAYDRRIYFWTLLQGELWQASKISPSRSTMLTVPLCRVWAQGGHLR